MNRHIIILLSLLLAFSPVASAFSVQTGSMQKSHGMSDVAMQSMSDCMTGEQRDSSNERSNCCHDEQCQQHCQTMQCHVTGKLPAFSLSTKLASTAVLLSQSHSRFYSRPFNGLSTTPYRPPIVHL